MIERERLVRLHQRVLRDDPVASAEVFTLLHKPIAATVRRRVGGMSWEEAGDVATDAIVKYVKSPGKFDPSKGSGLLGYLVMAAYFDALNLIRDRKARQRKVERSVELSLERGKESLSEVRDAIDARRIMRDHGHKLVVDAGDEEVLLLHLEGERDTAVYAEKLGIAHLSESEQRKIVKQRRDKLDQRMKRLGEDLK